jgi:hypothetical protein
MDLLLRARHADITTAVAENSTYVTKAARIGVPVTSKNTMFQELLMKTVSKANLAFSGIQQE